VAGERSDEPVEKGQPESLDALRRTYISYVLGFAHGDESAAARLLEITPGELRRLMGRLGVANPLKARDAAQHTE